MKILLVNCYADDNKGDHGILKGTIQALEAAHRAVTGQPPEISAISVFDKQTVAQGRAHRFLKKHVRQVIPATVPQKYIENAGVAASLWKVVKVTVLFVMGVLRIGAGRLSPEQRAIKQADLVVSKGGSFLYANGSIRGFFFLWRMLMPLIWAILLKRPTMVLGQSVGPFKGALSYGLARWVLRRCTYVYVREKFSEAILKEMDVAHVQVLPDMAFMLEGGAAPKKNSSKKAAQNASDTEKVLGVTLRHLSSDPAEQAEVEEKIARVLTGFLKKHKWRVYLIPQVIGPDTWQDDRAVQERVLALMSPAYRKYVKIARDDFSVAQLCETYGQCALMLATRLHSSIFAATQGTPAVVLEYQQKKAKGTYDLLGRGDSVVPWQADESQILDRLLDNAGDLPAQKKALETQVITVRKDIAAALEKILQTLYQRHVS